MKQETIDTFNGATNYQGAQRFMDESRATGHTDINSAVAAYVAALDLRGVDANADYDERSRIYDEMVWYLMNTQALEWS